MNMKLPCAVVRDLLPLYAEKMTEPETQSLIEEHLQDCPECQKRYAEMDVHESGTVDTASGLRTLKREIRRRRWWTALAAGLIVFVCIVISYYHAGCLKPTPWEEGLVEVTGIETRDSDDVLTQDVRISDAESGLPASGREALVLKMDGRIRGTQTEVMEEDGTVTAVIQGFGMQPSFSQPPLLLQEGSMTICPVPDRLIYGFEQPQKLLWGEPMNGGVQVLARLALAYYVLIAGAAALLSGLLWLIFRGWKRSWIFRQVFFAPIAYLLAHLLLMGLRTTSFFLVRDFCYFLVTACALYAMISLLWQIWLQYRKPAS